MNLKSNARRLKLRELLTLIILGVLMFVTKWIMDPLPNIELVSFLIIITARYYGVKSLISVYTFVLSQILLYPMGDWLVGYLYIWAIFTVIICLIRKIDSAFVFALVSGIFGLSFDILMFPVYFIEGGFAFALGKIISGAVFSLIHGGGNFVLALILYKPIVKAADKAFK